MSEAQVYIIERYEESQEYGESITRTSTNAPPGRYVPVEDVREMVEKAWLEGFAIAEYAEGSGVFEDIEWPKSDTYAALKRRGGE